MKTVAWVGVALYDANGVWLGSFPNGQAIPADIAARYTRCEVDVRIVEVEET